MIVYITVAQVSRILKWDHRKTTTWLKKAGALVSRGGKMVTTPDLLKSCFPEVYQSIVDAGYDAEEDTF